MGINSQEVAYGFGQLGSAFGSGTAALHPPVGMVVVAITSMAATTGFTILKRDTGEIQCVDVEASDPAHNAGSATATEGAGGQTLLGTTIPVGVTIYGRWTEVTGVGGSSYIAYFGV